MKRGLLCTAISSGLAMCAISGPSTAVMLNPRGTGQVLIYPYYTVNGGHQTLLSVVNTTATGKALRVRFREGMNGRDVLQFNLYLSEFDVWTGAVFELPAAPGADTPAYLATTDTSCTVPAIRTNSALPQLPNNGPRYVAFRTQSYSGGNADIGPSTLARTREGFVEMIEMGALIDNSASDRAITHSPTTALPRDCPGVVAAWAPSGYWTQDANVDLAAPSGGLFGAGVMVDVAEGMAMGYAAEAIEDFRSDALHMESASARPNLSDALTDTRGDLAVAYVPVNGKSVRSDYRASSNAIDAVSAVLMAQEALNEYSIEAALGAASEWVFTFPTRQYYTDPVLSGVSSGLPPFFRDTAIGGITGPFCAAFNPSPFNREETRPGPGWLAGITGIPQPGEVAPVQFCFASSIVSIGQQIVRGTTGPSRILGSKLVTRDIPVEAAGFRTGWMRISPTTPSGPNTPMRASIDGDVYRGLPVVGFAVTNYVNANAQPGRLANYSILTPHRVVTHCQTNATPPAACQ